MKPKTLFDTPENEDDFESESKPNDNVMFNSSFDADLNGGKIGALDMNEQEIKFENEMSDLGDNIELPDEEDISQMVNELSLNEKTEDILIKGMSKESTPLDSNNPENNMVFLKNYLIRNLKQLYRYDKTQIQKGVQFQVPVIPDSQLQNFCHNFEDLFPVEDRDNADLQKLNSLLNMYLQQVKLLNSGYQQALSNQVEQISMDQLLRQMDCFSDFKVFCPESGKLKKDMEFLELLFKAK